MQSDLPFFPVQASSYAHRIDALYLSILAVCVFFSLLIAILIVYYALKYRRRAGSPYPQRVPTNMKLELIWTAIPLIIAMIIFFWGANLYMVASSPPADAIDVYVVGKQWMWKLQHAGGRREINELHVPTGRAVRLTMTSEDVIHSFYVPAFRTKMDVLPGRYTTQWFEPIRPGEYHLFCAEYCGTKHSGMIGKVVVMEPARYQEWLGGLEGGKSTVALGEALFQQLGCATCHTGQATDESKRGPDLVGLYGREVKLESGGAVIADNNYIRESILRPASKLVAGYVNNMPTFEGQISEEGIMQIIAYVKSLTQPPARP